jgi:UDP-glucose 4-epimerase
MKVVVTGGAGFIGSHTVERLAAEGIEVLVIDDLSHPCPEPPPVQTEVADCGSAKAATAIVAFRPDALLHLASKGGVQRAARNPAEHATISLVSTIAVFEAAIRAGVRRIVTASSGGTIYGDAVQIPARESQAPAPVSAYGAAKRSEEVYLGAFGRRNGITTLALRYSNVYGPRQDGTGEAGLIAITCRRLGEGLPPVIYGDGQQTRDFTYVGDVAAANVSALRSTASGELNIGTGIETSVNRVVEVLTGCSGTDVEPEHAPQREGEVRRVALDWSSALTTLGWCPDVKLERGLEQTWTWFNTR